MRILSQLQRQIEILMKRKQNLETKLVQIDNLPNDQITKDTYRQWHEVYVKVSCLELRIATIRSKMEILSNKDIIRDVISGSKGLFRNLIRGKNEINK